MTWVSLGILVSLTLAGLFGPSLLQDKTQIQISNDILVGPAAGHLLGTDELGRSILTQLVYGVRTSLVIGLLAALSATLLGIAVGAVAGFTGGIVDTIVMRITEVFQVMPTFVLAAVIVALAGPGMFRVVLVIALLAWPQTARVMRGEVLRLKSFEFVSAVRCLGYREWSILWFEIVPNAIAPAIALGTLIIGQAILLEAALAFFGLTTPDVASWGLMLNEGQRFIRQAWWISVFPGLAILVTVLAFNLLGDCIGAAFSPRSREGQA
jgi:peptide/nickel transport system permease protein